MNVSAHEQFERDYRRIWGVLMRSDEPDLGQHERQLLHHIPPAGGVSLNWVARHLALPKSTASVLVKDLARRGFVRRTRDRHDERRLALVLTKKGADRVRADTVLQPDALAAALAALPDTVRRGLLRGFERLADVAEEQASARASVPGGSR
jgi:DNA-binding MarR family transcriptional regulator